MPNRPQETSVAVVTVNYRTPELTKRCIAAVAKERKSLPLLRAVVVDGGSGDGSAEQLADFFGQPEYAGWVEVLPLPINGGFGWANNQAVLTLARREHPPQFIHILNPDTEVFLGAIRTLVEAMLADPACGAAGSQLLDVDGNTSASAFRFPSPGREFVRASQSDALGRLLGIKPTIFAPTPGCQVDWVTGASVMLRSEALRETGLFDDGFFLYFEEVELMHRLRAAGWTIRHVEQSRVLHLEGAATGVGEARPLPRYWYESRRRFFALTGGAATMVAANGAWLVGRGLGMVKRLIGRFQNSSGTHFADLVHNGLLPKREDRIRSIPAWGDPPGRAPAWMASK